MLRRFSLLFTLGFVFSATSLQASPIILKELEKDKIELDPSAIYNEMNPLRRAIRPNLNEKALQYEYHAWSEVDAKNMYPIYRWEFKLQNGTKEVYELAKYWVATPKEADFFKELSEKEKDSLYLDMETGVVLGALSKTTLAVEPQTDSERYLIISKRPLTKVLDQVKPIPSLKIPTQEQVVPAPVTPPAPSRETEVEQVTYAEPVPGKKGFVYSKKLDANGKKQLIDVRGIDAGKKAKDPYTDEIFLVP